MIGFFDHLEVVLMPVCVFRVIVRMVNQAHGFELLIGGGFPLLDDSCLHHLVATREG